MIEVEVRGCVKDFEKTLREFKEKARFVREKDRFSLVYFRGGFCKDVRDLKDDPVDLRLRVTNKKAEMILKYGTWGSSDARHEISIPIQLENFGDAVDFLGFLGWSQGVVMATKTFVFICGGVEFSLVNQKDAFYFEAEKLVKNSEEADRANLEILSACREFDLEPFSEDEFMEMVNSINNQEGSQFDFTKQKFSEIKNIFNEFF
jgi:adenylate cyclase class IV